MSVSPACDDSVMNARPERLPALVEPGAIALPSNIALPSQIALCQAAICRDPTTAAHYLNLAWAAIEQDRPALGQRALARAIALDPNCFAAWQLQAQWAWQRGEPEAALAAAQRALALEPACAPLRAIAATVYRYRGELALARAEAERAITLDPQLFAAWGELGVIYGELGDLARAEACHQRCVAGMPDCAEAWYQWGNLYFYAGEYGRVIAPLERALAISPEHGAAGMNLALARLALGDWPRGFEDYEVRLRWRPELVPTSGLPVWTGEPRRGRAGTLLIEAEQGFGDALQFVRYAALAAARCDRVVLRVRRELVDLLATAPGLAAVWPDDVPLPPELGPATTAMIPLMSLPRIFGTTLATVPATVPYLRVPETIAPDWGDRLGLGAAGALHLGVVWASGQRSGHEFLLAQRAKSLSLEQLAAVLAEVAGPVRYWSLQVGPAAQELSGCPAGLEMTDLSPHLASFAETAAAIARLDGVITVDTAVAHLAGALGKPTWVLLPQPADWRWLDGGGSLADKYQVATPWYPTLRLVRQREAGQWEGALDRLGEALRSAYGDYKGDYKTDSLRQVCGPTMPSGARPF